MVGMTVIIVGFFIYLCDNYIINNPSGMKKGIIKLILALVIVFLLVRLCTSSFGSVITLPGGMGGSESDGSGGWFSPKEKTNE